MILFGVSWHVQGSTRSFCMFPLQRQPMSMHDLCLLPLPDKNHGVIDPI